jgi:hypothetical protein
LVRAQTQSTPVGHGPATLAPSTVDLILHQHGRIDPKASADATSWQRFERGEPNGLWQMDLKGDFDTLD